VVADDAQAVLCWKRSSRHKILIDVNFPVSLSTSAGSELRFFLDMVISVRSASTSVEQKVFTQK